MKNRFMFFVLIFLGIFFSCKSTATPPAEEGKFLPADISSVPPEDAAVPDHLESGQGGSPSEPVLPEPETELMEEPGISMPPSADATQPELGEPPEDVPEIPMAQVIPEPAENEVQGSPPEGAAESEVQGSPSGESETEAPYTPPLSQQPMEEPSEEEPVEYSPPLPFVRPAEEMPPVPEPPPPYIPPASPPPSSPPARQRPPDPPPFIRPAEPVPEPPQREPVPVPVPLPELPSRVQPETSSEDIIFSRIVRATVGQMIEIPFRGTGWVYLGELGNRRGITYHSRRLDLAREAPGLVLGQSFIFNAEAAGTYILKFYKQDFIQDYILNDHVQVIVGESPESAEQGRFGVPLDRGRVIAEPRWPPSSEYPQAEEEASGTIPNAIDEVAATGAGISPASPTQNSAVQSPALPQDSVPQSSADQGLAPQSAVPLQREEPLPIPPPVAQGSDIPPAAVSLAAPETNMPRLSSGDDGIVRVPDLAAVPQSGRAGSSLSEQIPDDALPDEYVRRARREYDAGRIEAALSILDLMKQRYPSGSDEAWWLYGQLLEANSPSRDIRLALEYYRRLLGEYPQSPRAGDAQRRIAYLERYYFNIR